MVFCESGITEKLAKITVLMVVSPHVRESNSGATRKSTF